MYNIMSSQGMRLKCLIVDDEPMALKLLESYIAKTPFLELTGACGSAVQALEVLHTETVDVIFLDIQMPDLTGLELSRMIPKSTRIVFTTAFDKYAVEGFRADALDYLLKPFNYQEFLTAAQKALEWFLLVRAGNGNPSNQTVGKQFLFVKSEYKQVRIDYNQVLFFEGWKDYVKIWLEGQPKPVLTILTLKWLEEELPHNMFMRVHRSFIVALDKIASVERGQILIGHERITVAEQYKSRFQEFLGTHSPD